MSVRNIYGVAGALILLSGPAFAQGTQSVSSFGINTLFIVFCGILVMWMTAGFAMLEAGFVRSKNVVNQCAKNLGLFAIATTAFLVCGYGLMFPGSNWVVPGFIGHAGPINFGSVGDSGNSFGTKSHADASLVFFQMMFCVAVASIVSGAVAERVKLIPFFIFVALFAGVLYPLQASWIWGGGFLADKLGFIDLAGSTAIHVVGGVAALTGTIVLGARNGRYVDGQKVPMTCFNLPVATLGALILWMGWFGFNAGSYLNFTTDADATNVSRILVNTNMAAAGGILAAALISYLRFFRFDLAYMINGALAGLVSITAEPLYPTPLLALAVGLIGGLIVFWGMTLLEKFQIDDVVGAIPVHFFCGAWGTLAVVLSNPEATLFGQAVSLAIIIAFVGTTTMFLWQILNTTFGLRVSARSEDMGVDAAELVMEM